MPELTSKFPREDKRITFFPNSTLKMSWTVDTKKIKESTGQKPLSSKVKNEKKKLKHI